MASPIQAETRPRLVFPETPIPGNGGILSYYERRASVSDALTRARSTWLRAIPNLVGPISLSLYGGTSDWQVTIDKDKLRGETPIFTPGKGQRHHPQREFAFYLDLDSDKYRITHSRRRKAPADNGEKNVSESNLHWAVQLAQEDLNELLKPAEDAVNKTPVTTVLFPGEEPEAEKSLYAQLIDAPRETLATLLKPTPNFIKADFSLRDSLGQIWRLKVMDTLVIAVRSAQKGTEIEKFTIDSSSSSEYHARYSVQGKPFGREGSPDVSRKALDRLAELLAPARKARGQ